MQTFGQSTDNFRTRHIKLVLVTFFCLNFFPKISAQENVSRIIDGDTFEISSGDKIRLIGINAPEIKNRYGDESRQYLKSLIENQYVILQSDPLTKDVDIYGRLLRYVYLNNEDINKKMIENGFALAYLKYPFTKANEYKIAEKIAKKEMRGLWSENKNVSEKPTGLNKYYMIGIGLIILIAFLTYYLKK